jgi:hypothetical protein
MSLTLERVARPARLAGPVLLAPAQREASLWDELNRLTRAGSAQPALQAWHDAGFAKYGEPFLEAEVRKVRLREVWARLEAHVKRPATDYMQAARGFWSVYEEVNRRLIPDDPVYSVTMMGRSLSTSADYIALLAAATSQGRLLESFLGGEATSSTVLRVAVQRSTSGTTPATQTPEKFNTLSPAAAFSAAVQTGSASWTTQPTLSGNPLITHTFNAFGGTDRWLAALGAEIYLTNSGQLSFRSASGTPAASAHVIWEEL